MVTWSRWWITVLVIPAGILLAGMIVAWAGWYNVAADAPHWRVTSAFLEQVRDRSIESRSATLVVPDLADPALIRDGAGHYAAMCDDCHLAPGMEHSELRAGLYPQPPVLATADRMRSPSADFWIVKHGLKMTGMPAWGATHDDRSLWGLVAFVRQLPQLTAQDYLALVGGAEGEGSGGDHEGHQHAGSEPGHGDDNAHDHGGAMPDTEQAGHNDGHHDQEHGHEHGEHAAP